MEKTAAAGTGTEYKVLISEAELDAIVSGIASEIMRDYAGKELYLVCIMNGAVCFAADLIRKLPGLDIHLHAIKTKSYSGTTAGDVQIGDFDISILKGRNVIVADDILDTGKTLSAVCSLMKKALPASLRTCVLLDKPSRRETDFNADYSGREIPDKFVFGYGLDDAEGLRRNLPFVAYQ